jgi:antitoxin FitA
MPRTITVKNIPDDIYDGIKREAHLHHRSMNNEIIDIFEKKTKSRRISKEDVLYKARILREKTTGYFLTEKELNKAKNEGRL